MNQYQWERFKNDTSRPASKLSASYYEAYTTNGFADANPAIVSKGYVPGRTKSTTMTGNFNLHYDESLVHLTTLGGYDAVSWEEM
jgi:hypothetical protein